MIICLRYYQMSCEECSYKEEIIMYDDASVHNICLALTTNLLAH